MKIGIPDRTVTQKCDGTHAGIVRLIGNIHQALCSGEKLYGHEKVSFDASLRKTVKRSGSK